jgi:hypothetical protein
VSGDRRRLVVEGRVRPGRRGCWLAVCTVALLLAGLAAGPAAGAAKPYEAALTPATANAGSTFWVTLTLTNRSDQKLGSAEVTVPEGLSLVAVGAPVASAGKTWTAVVAADRPGVVTLGAAGSGPANRLRTDQSVALPLQLTAPCQAGSFRFDTRAKQANDFNGDPGNDLTLADADEPVLAVPDSCRLAIFSIADFGGGDPVAGEPFSVVVQLRNDAGPVPAPEAVPVALSATGPGALGGITSGVISQGSTDTTIAGPTYSTEANGVVLTAGTTVAGIGPATATLDVLRAKAVVAAGATGGGTCTDTGPYDICVRLTLPAAAGSAITLTERACSGLLDGCLSGLLGEALGAFGPAITRAAPARITIEYDKLFKITSKAVLYVDALKGAGPVPAPRCAKHGKVGESQTFCLDRYSKDGAGDTLFDVLAIDDPRLGTR